MNGRRLFPAVYRSLESSEELAAGWDIVAGRRSTRIWRYSFREHAVLLIGISSTSVRVHDPWHGTQEWISKATFERSWADFNNMAVIFR